MTLSKQWMDAQQWQECFHAHFVLSCLLDGLGLHAALPDKMLLHELQSPAAEQSESGECSNIYQHECTLLHDSNFNVTCEACIQRPAYYGMCSREDSEQFFRGQVSKIYTWRLILGLSHVTVGVMFILHINYAYTDFIL